MRDFAYPGTRGEQLADLEEQAQYFADVDAFTAEDLEVQRLVTEVLNLAKPLSALREEPLRGRVEAYKRPRQGSPLRVAREAGEEWPGASASEPGTRPVGKGLSSTCREPRMDPAL